jgi:CRISPR system Cascade subunit CasE
VSFIISAPMAHPVFRQGRWEDLNWVHKRVMGLFGPIDTPGLARAGAAILYRVEPSIRGGRVLVQSSQRPETSGLEVRDLAPVLEVLTAGKKAAFIIKVNAVRTVNRTGDDGKVRTHRAHVGREEIPAWLSQRITGLDIHDTVDMATSYERFGKTPLYVATCKGVGTVTDPEALSEVVQNGIGKARSYGCGILTIIPTTPKH